MIVIRDCIFHPTHLTKLYEIKKEICIFVIKVIKNIYNYKKMQKILAKFFKLLYTCKCSEGNA